MYAQYKELKAFFSKRNDIDFVDLYLPDKKEFIESLKNADIAHIICHGTILEDGQQGLLLEKEKYAFDKPELFEGDVDMVKTNKEQSISEFELALQSGKTREELEKDYYIITKDDYKNKAVAPVLFLNACYSLNIQIDWDNSLFSEFINSGVKNIIGTHWVVPQNAAKEVSKDFYINLLKGDTIGQSLKKSLEKQSDPFIRRNYYILGNHQISLR
jgi:CHAT domain-containing protein